MLREALSVPTRTDDAVTTLFMGGFLVLVATVAPAVCVLAVASTPAALVLTPLAVFPPLVLRGYYVRTVRTGLEGGDATPSFVRWSGLVRDGAKSVLLSLGYLLPLGLLGGVVALSATLLAANLVTPDSPAGLASALGVVLGGLGALGYGVAYLYLRPAALAVFAVDGRLRDGFALRRVIGVARSSRYAGGWGRAVLVLAVGLAVAAPTALALVGVFLAFYVRVVAHVLYGRGAAPALGTDVADEGEVGGPDSVRLGDRPGEASPSVQTGRTVGVGIGVGPVASTPGRDAEVDGGDSALGVGPAEGGDDATDSFVWHSPESREEARPTDGER